MSVTRDIMDLLASWGYGEVGKGIYDPQLLGLRKPSHGILVEQRNTSPEPDVLNQTDTVYMNVQVRGPGGGERGKRAAYETAMELYRHLNLILDIRINETLYLKIQPDTAPYEVPSSGNTGTDRDYLFGLEVVRYYGPEE